MAGHSESPPRRLGPRPGQGRLTRLHEDGAPTSSGGPEPPAAAAAGDRAKTSAGREEHLPAPRRGSAGQGDRRRARRGAPRQLRSPGSRRACAASGDGERRERERPQGRGPPAPSRSASPWRCRRVSSIRPAAPALGSRRHAQPRRARVPRVGPGHGPPPPEDASAKRSRRGRARAGKTGRAR